MLTRAGYAVLTAADGLEAMKIAISRRVDAIVTDAVMPHLSGHELCRFLRRHPTLSTTPVIMLSGLGQEQPRPSGDADVDVHLRKPIKPEELTGSLEQLLLKTAWHNLNFCRRQRFLVSPETPAAILLGGRGLFG
jgi:DNA-binding response OmpR family regulator